ncbi:hypothetical protein N7520_004828 [Penicillium odoratum]|uniref:uncharacterized protein n=1 Tax=Penicillium odoratum TaxID=1167516 RepID=UPI002547CF48|nr:uncharacterized protein N7520_004828 [Penicillium odoratum]KAJ5765269.1 hypothetical protein N7520_004828 [Penicillium odoratum]
MASKTFKFSELPPDQRILSGQKYRKSLYYAAQAAIWTGYLYFGIRLLAVLSSPYQWQTWIMLAVELIFAHLARKEQLRSITAGKVQNGGPRKRLRLQGDDLPRVDVLLPCCGEPVDIIMQTVQAACVMDYPNFRVRLLDDGGSALLKKTVLGLQDQWPHLSYHSRGRQSGQVFAKSGNLNYALTTLQKDDPPEFCAVLDADSIPSPDFLRATLPHLLETSPSGPVLVSTRQYFSNLPKGDPLSQARCHFYTCQNAELDILGRAIDAGSGAVFRRQTIMDVGLYPTFSFSEDWQLSLVLQGFGHQTVQVQEPLQYGLVPTSITGHIAQRSRWNIGHAQQIVSMYSRDSSFAKFPKDLQRNIAWNGVGIIGGEVSCLIGFAVIPVLLLAACGDMIPATTSITNTLQVILATLYILLNWIYEFCQAAQTGFQSAPFAHLENKWQAAGNIYSILRFYLLTSKPKGSFVTGSTANSWNRLTGSSMSSYIRLYRDLWENRLFCNVIVLIATLGAMFYTTAVVLSGNQSLIKLLTSIAWPPLLHVCYLSIVNNWVPVAYLLDPPNYPDRKA